MLTFNRTKFFHLLGQKKAKQTSSLLTYCQKYLTFLFSIYVPSPHGPQHEAPPTSAH